MLGANTPSVGNGGVITMPLAGKISAVVVAVAFAK